MPSFRHIVDSDKRMRELIDTAKKVEGIARHASTHAAGVVISRDPLVEHVPLQRAGARARATSRRSIRWASSRRSGCSRWTSSA